jgi:5-methylcytosine-specific restriction endonuclease McrA
MKRVSDKQRQKNKDYAKKRKLAYERDKGLCVLCSSPATEVHHIIFRSHGGTHELNNLACLCRVCHEMAHGVEAKRVKETLLERI